MEWLNGWKISVMVKDSFYSKDIAKKLNETFGYVNAVPYYDSNSSEECDAYVVSWKDVVDWSYENLDPKKTIVTSMVPKYLQEAKKRGFEYTIDKDKLLEWIDDNKEIKSLFWKLFWK
jgi:hypothetical protein